MKHSFWDIQCRESDFTRTIVLVCCAVVWNYIIEYVLNVGILDAWHNGTVSYNLNQDTNDFKYLTNTFLGQFFGLFLLHNS